MKTFFKREVLGNGMVLLFEKRDLPLISMAIGVRQGGINEFYHEKGISHFIEHLLYRGTKKRTQQKIAFDIEKNGGELNGFTSENLTAYWCKMPSKHISVALDVLSDMVSNPRFDVGDIEKERHIILEEMKMYKDNPYLYVFEKIQENLYKKPFGAPLIGIETSLYSITKEILIKKFHEVYQPENMIFCLVGDADFNYVKHFLENMFKGGRARVNKIKIQKQNKITKEFRKGIDQANLVFAYHTPLFGNKKSYAAILLNVLMAVGMSSRLFREIREKRNLAYSIKGQSNIHRDFSFNTIHVGAKKENISLIKKIILNEFERVSKELSREELKGIKEQVIGNYYLDLEDSYTQMINLLYNEVNGDVWSTYKFEENILNVNVREIRELSKYVLKNNSCFVLIPKNP